MPGPRRGMLEGAGIPPQVAMGNTRSNGKQPRKRGGMCWPGVPKSSCWC